MHRVVIALVGLTLMAAASDGWAQDKKPAVPEFLKTWAYPKAKFEPTDGPYFRAVMTTPDDSKKVLEYYTKVALPAAGRPYRLRGGMMSVQTNEMLTEIRDLSAKKDRGIDKDQPASSVWVHTVLQDHPDYCVHVVITRAKDEKQTQVFLSYIRKKPVEKAPKNSEIQRGRSSN
jgi:hypothetical protein